MQYKLTKARSSFYLKKKTADSKFNFKFLDAKLYAKHIEPAVLSAHHSTLSKGVIARYNMTRFEHKSYTFSYGSNCLSIDNAILGPIPKRLLFTMVKNMDFLVSLDTNPYKFHLTISVILLCS